MFKKTKIFFEDLWYIITRDKDNSIEFQDMVDNQYVCHLENELKRLAEKIEELESNDTGYKEMITQLIDGANQLKEIASTAIDIANGVNSASEDDSDVEIISTVH